MQNSADMLASALREYIENNLGRVALNKIESRLVEQHDMGLGQAMKDTTKVNDVFKEIFGAIAQELESQFIQSIKLDPSKINTDNWAAVKELLVSSIRQSIEENLGRHTLNKIESRLVEQHNINITLAVDDLSKLNSVLQEFFGSGSHNLESKFVQNIIKS
jgi:RNase P/RNase MRP subunit POP5